MPGHTRETCFQLNDYPQWYQQYKAQKENANTTKAETNKSTPFDYTGDLVNKQDSVAGMLQGLQLELDKIKEKMQGEGHAVNLTQVNEYAGIILNLQTMITALHTTFDTLDKIKPGSWIIDTGATTHMCTNLNMFTEVAPTPYPISIKLPDGSIRQVTQMESINLTPKLVLQGVLYTPNFKFNLISINKLVTATQAKFVFLPISLPSTGPED